MTKGRYARQDKMIKEKRHDVYRDREKWPEPTLCTGCGALFTNGRWTWKETAEEANKAEKEIARSKSKTLDFGI